MAPSSRGGWAASSAARSVAAQFAFRSAQRRASYLLAVILLGATAGPLGAQAPAVGTVYAVRKPIARTGDFVGRVQAINRVEVKARVQGYLEKVLFKEGDFVKVGDPLYLIEQGPFIAAVEQAQAALDKSQAEKILTEVQLKRQETLLAQNSTAASARDQALAADKEAAATILSNQASLDNAKINLGYTNITSPIDGKISRTNVTIGNVVGPDSGTLTLIVSQDPIYVTFPVSQREFLRVQSSGPQPDVKSIKVKLRFADGSTYDQEGTIDFIDVSVNQATDTVLVRAVIPNPAGKLIDGQFVNVTVQSGKPQEQVVVPQAALLADQEGVYVLVVQDGKVAMKRIKVGNEVGTDVAVTEGLQGGEQVIVQGIQNVRPGQPVQASPLPATLQRS